MCYQKSSSTRKKQFQLINSEVISGGTMTDNSFSNETLTNSLNTSNDSRLISNLSAHIQRLHLNKTTLMDTVPEDLRPFVSLHWSQFPPPPRAWHLVFGVTYIVFGIVSLTGNGMVIFLFSRAKSLRSPANLLVINLALSDFMMMTTQFPLLTANCFAERWLLGPIACQMYGFFGALFGCSSIITMALIALDRYFVIVCPFSKHRLTFKTAFIWVIISWVYCLGWCLMPFIGWNAFVPEGFLTSCTFDYLSQSWTSRSYVIILCIVAYILPLTVICFCYASIVASVRKHQKYLQNQAIKMKVDNLTTNQDQSWKKREVKLAKIFLVVIALWVIAWTPYAIISLMGVFGGRNWITPYTAMLPALFAKTASIYNPIVYAISHPRYRQEFKKLWFPPKLRDRGETYSLSEISNNSQKNCTIRETRL